MNTPTQPDQPPIHDPDPAGVDVPVPPIEDPKPFIPSDLPPGRHEPAG